MVLRTEPIWFVCSGCGWTSSHVTDSVVHALKEKHILDMEFPPEAV